MTTAKRRLNLNVGLNTTGYLPHAWKYRSGSRHDINDPLYYRRLTELAHRGRFDAVFFSDHPALLTDPESRPFHTLDPLILATALTAQAPDIGVVATISSTYNSPYNLARRAQSVDIRTAASIRATTTAARCATATACPTRTERAAAAGASRPAA